MLSAISGTLRFKNAECDLGDLDENLVRAQAGEAG